MRLRPKWPFVSRRSYRARRGSEILTPEPAEPIVIGWRERVDLPEWGLFSIQAKADTGARSSAIDVDNIEELPHDRVRFEVVVRRTGRGLRKVMEAPVSRRSRVRSSLGDDHARIFVSTRLSLAGRLVTTEIGLVSRESMISRMLLGRRCLEGAFLVDSGRRYVHGNRPQVSTLSRGH